MNKIFLVLTSIFASMLVAVEGPTSARSNSSSASAKSAKSTARRRVPMKSTQAEEIIVVEDLNDEQRRILRDKTFQDTVTRKVYNQNLFDNLESTSKCRAALWLYNQRQKSEFLKDEVLAEFMQLFLMQLAEGCQEFYEEVYKTF